MSTHIETGRTGERIALRYLQHLGYAILDTNVRLGRDEIDIIAHDPEDDTIVFTEVKTRTKQSRDFTPALNLTRDKKHCMLRAARRWMANTQSISGFRLDLLCVAGGTVTDHCKRIGWNDYQ